MSRIYLAGKISSKDPLEFLENIRNGQAWSTWVISLGHDVYSPFLDYQFAFHPPVPTKEQYRSNSMSFLEHWAEEVWVLPDWENSGGTKKEIERANELKIPVRYL